jgi:hypothetical protein
MKVKLPSSDTMDKIVLGVAIVGCIVAIATVNAISEPEEIHERARHVINDLKDLNVMTAGAVHRGDFQLACELQKTSVELMTETNVVNDETFFLSLEIKNDLCDRAKEGTI